MIVSVVIPVAKEGNTLYERIHLINKHFNSLSSSHKFSYEIILVSDIFHKPTLKAMIRLAKENVAKCLLLTQRIGKGGSIKNAIPFSRGDYIVILDADIPVRPIFINQAVVLAMNLGIDLIIANRVYRTHSLLRRVLSVAYNSLVNLLFKTGLRDHQAGLKILSRRAAKIILMKRTRTDGLAYDTEIVVWAKRHGLRYRAVNVVWREQREGSTIPPMRALLTMLADLIMLRLLTLAGKYVALQKLVIGRVIDLGNIHTVGQEFMTVIRASRPKNHLLNVLRKLYIAVALRR
ncbi:glycosyl transferase, family 2 [Aeropyrum pernix K1]|uniref:Glycosyl transferase, family 2 n=1 Tax=Aeropyrum pernix (strain ATCC 700893 / DSM 11879 / JCM 9820 / NBRC 100138 / K1) TaxID=272557 RepID=Q9YCR9_AERPE|nr:glycosyltransferase [Aeropyrum pernix]BAA80178.1 glycosyl transferase, family 2 [Aeropyrum pernix K1]